MNSKKEERILSFLAVVGQKNPNDHHHDKKKGREQGNDGDSVVVTNNNAVKDNVQPSRRRPTSTTATIPNYCSNRDETDDCNTNATTKKLLVVQHHTTFLCKLSQKTKLVLYHLFLPTGYPQSVKAGYIQYQTYDSIQGLCSYLRGVISTSAILTAAGVGNANATATSAAIQWAIKDGCGMLGGLLFSYFASVYFDSHVKEFRLFADVMNDVGLVLDMMSPLFLSRWWKKSGDDADDDDADNDDAWIVVAMSFLYRMVSMMATLCRVMCGMAAGATKHCITEHFANRGNSADLSAKEGTQETLVSLLGMMLGIGLATFLQEMEENCKILRQQKRQRQQTQPQSMWYYQYGAFYATWFVFGILTIVHVWANYQGVKILKFNTLNPARCKFVMEDILNEIQMQLLCCRGQHDDGDGKNMKFLKVEDIGRLQDRSKNYNNNNKQSSKIPIAMRTPEECCENLWDSWKSLIWNKDKIVLGASIKEAFRGIDDSNVSLVKDILNLFKEDGYILTMNVDGLICVSLTVEDDFPQKDGKEQQIGTGTVPLQDSIRQKERNVAMLKSFVHATVLQRCLENKTIATRTNISCRNGAHSRRKKNNKTKNQICSAPADDETAQKRRMNDAMTLIKVSKQHVDSLFPTNGKHTLLDLLHDFGWNVERLYLCFQEE
jgi:hypothetical protein